MSPMESMREAEQEAAAARLAMRTAFRPLTRESARRQAEKAEDEYIAARLLYWQGVFNINPAGKAKE